MSVKTLFSYKPGTVASLKAVYINDAHEYLPTDGVFEVYNAINAAAYTTPMGEIAGGAYECIVPTIQPQFLPVRIMALVYDNDLGLSHAPVGQSPGYTRVDNNNNEQDDPKLLNNIFASTVGNNLGVGTTQETYYGADNVLAFTSIFDTNGNRQVTVE